MHNISGKHQRIWRGLLLVPWVIPLALSTLTWWWMFDPSYSAFNWVLNEFGLKSVPWLGVGWIARFCTITVNVWYGTPFFMIMYLAALKSVPEQLYEAAAIDGASAMQKLFFVTLPMMRNIIAITVLFSLIVTFADFDIVRILTNGGPRGHDACVRHLCFPGRHPVGRHSAGRGGQPVHAARSWRSRHSSCCAV